MHFLPRGDKTLMVEAQDCGGGKQKIYSNFDYLFLADCCKQNLIIVAINVKFSVSSGNVPQEIPPSGLGYACQNDLD